ncbi:MAG: D-glycerate dehydrogenase [Peptostreptococcaceae bacterium]|nr:D-glycerate dehydrogenase [Peptostreptococcaceae bacterium]
MKLFITSSIPDNIYKKLENEFEIIYHDSNEPLTKQEIIDKICEVDVLFCPLSDKIDEEIINSAKNLKLVVNYGAGFDNIDLKSANKNNISVCNTPAKSSAYSTSELAFLLILSCARDVVGGKSELKSGNFKGWRPTYHLGTQLHGKTLGIIGFGNIGQSLAKKAVAFGMNVLYNANHQKKELEIETIKFATKDEIYKNSDFISLNLSYNDKLFHMIDAEQFDMMKNTAFLINSARGKVVSEQALINAIKDKKIAGAALDVYEFEPKVSKELLSFDNCICTPHIGNATVEAREEMGKIAVDNILAFKNGKEMKNKIN